MSQEKEAQFAFSTEYSYNVFHADEHFDVYFWRKNEHGAWVRQDYWSYACGIFPFQKALAHSLANKKIQKLRNLYDAVPI